MWHLHHRSRLMTEDELLPCLREGTGLGVGEPINYVDGKPVKRDPMTFLLACNVQPLSGRDLMLVPEGDRTTEQFNLWQWADDDALKVTVNDKILRMDKTYVVQSAEDWGSYVMARAMLVDVPDDARTALAQFAQTTSDACRC